MTLNKDQSRHDDETAKFQLAMEISKILVKEGRSDILPEELEELLEIFIHSENEQPNLTDEDLQTLLRNFFGLTSDEQSRLIVYLTEIEKTNPARVENLKKYVNIGDGDLDMYLDSAGVV